MSEFKNFHDWQAEKAPLIARVVRAEAEVERLRAVSDELQGWRDRAVASCIKRRCDSRDRRAGELETEVERLRAAAPIIHTLDVDDLVREVGRKVDAWTHDGSSHHDLKAACAEAIRKTAPEVASAPALPDNADPGDEAQPARSGEAERERCGVCGWTLAESRDNGCVAGDCSYRPEEGSDEWCRIRRKRDEIAAKKQPTPQPAPSGVVRSPDGVWTNSLSDAIAPLFVPAPRLRLPGKVAEMPQEDGIELGYAHGWSDGWNAAIHAAKAEARAQGFEVASAPALPDNADPGDEAQPASPTDEGVAHAYASHLREARAARAILEAPLLARIAELEQIRQDAITGLGRIDRALGAGGAK